MVAQTQRTSLLELWYKLTAPAELPETESLRKREVVRRARIISLAMLVTVLLTALPFPFHPSVQIAAGLVVALMLDLVALIVFNRRGKILVSGLIITGTTELGILAELSSQLALYHGLHLGFVPFLCLLIQGVAVAASTLDISIAFVIFLLNCAFLVAVVKLVPYSSDITAYLLTPEGAEGLIETPLSCFIVGFFLIAIWVNSANNALRRAERSDERALLAEKIAERDREAVAQKRQLEQDLDEIVQTIAAIANGKPFALRQDNTLLAIGIALDHLRMRLFKMDGALQQQHLKERRIEAAVALLAAHLRAGTPLRTWQPTGTIVDQLVLPFGTALQQAQAHNEFLPSQERLERQMNLAPWEEGRSKSSGKE